MKILLKYILPVVLLLFLQSCSRADENEDVFTQEEISAIELTVVDELSGASSTYTYIANSAFQPAILLQDGRNYLVSVAFRNGAEDITDEIIDERDEHFLIFGFTDTDITLTRLDDDLRTDGKRLGVKSRWQVNNTITGSTPKLNLALIHDAADVSEDQMGTAWGSVTGGETDAVAVFSITD